MGSLEQRLARLEGRTAGDGSLTPEAEAERARRFDALFEELAELGVQRGEPREDPVGDLMTMIENYRKNGDTHDDQDN